MSNQTQAVSKEEVVSKLPSIEGFVADFKALVAANVEAVNNSNILAIYDSGGSDNATIDAESASYVVENLIASLCYNTENGLIEGNKLIIKADEIQERAAIRDNNMHDQKSQEYLEGRQTWLCRMECQQEFRKNLVNLTRSIYKEYVGVEYVFAKTAAPAATRDTAAQSVSQKLAARKAAS